MHKPTIKSYAAWVLLTEAIGALSGWLSRDGIRGFSETAVQPSFSPPAIVFPLVWILLYGLMGISAARIAAEPNRGKALNVFFAQLIVNFFWSPLFFSAQAYGFAFFWLFLLWVLVLIMIVRFWKIDRPAAALQIPYLLWLTLAAVLNFAVWQLNG